MPLRLGDQTSAYVCPCTCRKRRLIMLYILSYTTGLLYAWSSCMQWGVWVWTVGRLVNYPGYGNIGGWDLFIKGQTASLRGDPELQAQSSARASLKLTPCTPYGTSITYSSFLPPPGKPLVKAGLWVLLLAAVTLESKLPDHHHFVYCILNIKLFMEFLYLILYACPRLRFLDVETNPGQQRPVPAV